MIWIFFALGAVVTWGMYGPALNRGQVRLGNPLRALLCVGVAYFLIGVLVPVVALWRQGELTGFPVRGSVVATLAGVLGEPIGIEDPIAFLPEPKEGIEERIEQLARRWRVAASRPG